MSDQPQPPCPTKFSSAVPLHWRLAAAALVIFAIFTMLYVARAVMLPIALAFVLSFLLSPLVRSLGRLRIPPVLGAGLIIVGLLGFLGSALLVLSGPAAEWFQRAPAAAAQLEQRLESVNQLLRKFTRATERVEELARATDDAEVTVQVQGTGLRGFLLSVTWQFAAGIAVLVFLLYFLLASGDLFLRRLVTVLPNLRQKKIAVAVSRRIQADITHYLFTVTLINTGLGFVTATAMKFLGMPNPVLWGATATLLNFIPYLGPTVTLGVIATVALLAFEAWTDALLPPLTFLIITSLEGQLLTPYILGRRLMLNPVVIFVGLIFWAWLWGIPGALLAVPMTMMIKIVCDAVPPLAPIGTFMSR